MSYFTYYPEEILRIGIYEVNIVAHYSESLINGEYYGNYTGDLSVYIYKGVNKILTFDNVLIDKQYNCLYWYRVFKLKMLNEKTY